MGSFLLRCNFTTSFRDSYTLPMGPPDDFFLWKQPGVAPVFLFSNTKTRLARSRSGSKKLDHRCYLTRIGRQTNHSLISTAAGLSRNTASTVRLVPLLIRGQDRWYAVPVTGVREGNYMLLFYCAHCAKMVTADDDESLNQIVDWLDEHITKCPLATFTYEGTTN